MLGELHETAGRLDEALSAVRAAMAAERRDHDRAARLRTRLAAVTGTWAGRPSSHEAIREQEWRSSTAAAIREAAALLGAGPGRGPRAGETHDVAAGADAAGPENGSPSDPAPTPDGTDRARAHAVDPGGATSSSRRARRLAAESAEAVGWSDAAPPELGATASARPGATRQVNAAPAATTDTGRSVAVGRPAGSGSLIGDALFRELVGDAVPESTSSAAAEPSARPVGQVDPALRDTVVFERDPRLGSTVAVPSVHPAGGGGSAASVVGTPAPQADGSADGARRVGPRSGVRARSGWVRRSPVAHVLGATGTADLRNRARATGARQARPRRPDHGNRDAGPEKPERRRASGVLAPPTPTASASATSWPALRRLPQHLRTRAAISSDDGDSGWRCAQSSGPRHRGYPRRRQAGRRQHQPGAPGGTHVISRTREQIPAAEPSPDPDAGSAGTQTGGSTAPRDAIDAGLDVLYRRHTPDLVRSGDPGPILRAAAESHRELARHRAPGQELIRIRDAAGESGGAVLEIVTDDMPFLVESVLAAVRRAGRRGPAGHPPDRGRARARRPASCARGPHRRRPGGPAAGDTLVESWIHLDLGRPPVAGRARGGRSPGAARRPRGRRGRRADGRQAGAPPSSPTRLPPATPAAPSAAPGRPTSRSCCAGSPTGTSRSSATATHAAAGTASCARAGPGPRRAAARRPASPLALAPGASPATTATTLLVITRASAPSRVCARCTRTTSRSAPSTPADGCIGEHRFLGMLTVAALLRERAGHPGGRAPGRAARSSRAGFPLESYSGQQMLEVISGLPREELFSAHRAAAARHRGRACWPSPAAGRCALFLRPDPYRRFISCLVYLPRDRYTTSSRLRDGRRAAAPARRHVGRLHGAGLASRGWRWCTSRCTTDPRRRRLRRRSTSTACRTSSPRPSAPGTTGCSCPSRTAASGRRAAAPGSRRRTRPRVDPARAVEDLRHDRRRWRARATSTCGSTRPTSGDGPPVHASTWPAPRPR